MWLTCTVIMYYVEYEHEPTREMSMSDTGTLSCNDASHDNDNILSCIITSVLAVLIFLLLVAYTFSYPSMVDDLYGGSIYEYYGTSLKVVDVTSFAGGRGDTWVAECASLDASPDKQPLVLVPEDARVKAPEEGMTISYNICWVRTGIDEGEQPEVEVDDWRELMAQE